MCAKTSIFFVIAHASLVLGGAPRISTTSGNLQGFTANNVDVFLGIPYAFPPVGNLRWRNAVKYAPSNASVTVNATKLGPACGQLSVPGLGSVYVEIGFQVLPSLQSEDCLTLNVWTPTTVSPAIFIALSLR